MAFPACTGSPLPGVTPLWLKDELLERERWHFTGCGSENGPLGVYVRVRVGWGLEMQLDYNPRM